MRSLWAVARETFTECIRTKAAAVFVLLLVVSLPAMGLTIEGDGTLKGRIQTFLAYSTSWAQLLLALATVLLTVSVITEDVRAKTIFTVAAKPLGRWQYLAGRWLGVVMLDAVLLAMAGGGIYGLARHLRSLPTKTEQEVQLGLAPEGLVDVDRLAVENEVFSARIAHKPEPFDVKAAAEARYERLVAERGADNLIQDRIRDNLAKARGTEPDDDERRKQIAARLKKEVDKRMRDGELRKQVVATLKEDVRKQLTEEKQIIRPGGRRRLTFSGLAAPSEAGQTVQVRYLLRIVGTGGVKVDATVRSLWWFENPKPSPSITRTDPHGQTTSIMVTSEAITSKGTLTLVYVNYDARRGGPMVKLDLNDVSVLYPVATFEGSFLRANLLIFARLAFLAAIGLLFGSFLSFRVACLSCLIVLLISVMSGFVLEATAILPAVAEPGPFDYYSHYLVRGVFFVLPQLPLTSSPADALIDGTNISWATVGAEAGAGTALRAILALAIGWVIFRRRELARVQV